MEEDTKQTDSGGEEGVSRQMGKKEGRELSVLLRLQLNYQNLLQESFLT